MTYYHRLTALVLLGNLIFLEYGLASSQFFRSDLEAVRTTSDLVLINFAGAIVLRQPYVINLLFALATRAPLSWPLAVRRRLAKVYHFGGLHVGGTLAGSAWFLANAVLLARDRTGGDPGVSFAVLGVSWLIVALLVGMIVFALPPLRARFHDHFERSHRFGGWAVLLLLWVQSLLLLPDRGGVSFGQALLGAPSVWVLLIVTLSVALPWAHLRRVEVHTERPSSHVALLRLERGPRALPGSTSTLSRQPLREWHAFANVPAPGEPGFRLIVSRAGDWTGGLIDDGPTKLWVKSVPTAGMATVARLYRRVVWVATGSGIGPVLPHLLAGQTPAHLIWSARSPRATYGDALVDEVRAAQPAALIWDTDERGRPDLLRLALEAYRSSGAEAVICIANQPLTARLVYELERRGVPANGAIWDS